MSLGGIVVIGLAGTVIIRRAMKALEQLSEVATQVSRLPLDAGDVALAGAGASRTALATVWLSAGVAAQGDAPPS